MIAYGVRRTAEGGKRRATPVIAVHDSRFLIRDCPSPPLTADGLYMH